MRQAGVDNFFLGGCEIVFHPALFNHIAFDVINAIRGVPIAVARLADAAYVDEVFLAGIDL